MKKTYIFLLFFSASYLNIFAQSDCSSAQAHIVYALSHSESALDANNVTHAKHFAKKAKEAFERVQVSLKDCHCDEVDDYVYNAIEYLSKAKTAEKLDDAYYYANKGKSLAETSIEKLDICTSVSDDVSIADTFDETNELSSSAYEQDQLMQQQLELERKHAEIKQKIARKKKQELYLKKEKLIIKMELVVLNNVKTFNTALSDCNCNTEILNVAIDNEDLFSKSLDDIRLSYIDTIKELSSDYTLKLVDCKN